MLRLDKKLNTAPDFKLSTSYDSIKYETLISLKLL